MKHFITTNIFYTKQKNIFFSLPSNMNFLLPEISILYVFFYIHFSLSYLLQNILYQFSDLQFTQV